jgi:MoxR-like ATPase
VDQGEGAALTITPMPLDGFLRTTSAIRTAVETVVEGKPEVVDLAVTVLVAEGHLLVEDVPGVGKTMLAKALARAVGSSVRRIQFTPDLLPSDITGVSVYNQERKDFEFKPGAVFANVVVGDEINRASPKTQNPVEMEGTYPLPEAQRDRFMARVSMGYPAAAAEVEMLDRHAGHDPLSELDPVTDAEGVRQLIQTTRGVYAAPAVKEYVVALVGATRSTPDLRLGASPRAALHLLQAAKASAAMAGRDHVLPDDVRDLVPAVLSHRLIASPEAVLARRAPDDVLAGLLAHVPVPRSRASA